MFAPLIEEIGRLSGKTYGQTEEITKAMRVIADHVKAAVFILGDRHGISPANVDQGYILRRLIRRAVRYGRQIGIEGFFTAALAEKVIGLYAAAYPELSDNRQRILDELVAEEDKFSKTLQHGLNEVRKIGARHAEAALLPGDAAFYLYESFGFPMELTEEVLQKKVDAAAFDAEMKKHQEMSRAGAEQKFSGGLADHSEQVVRLHTATHMLHAALRQVLGDHVEQRGSNITAERLRFDFSHPQKMTPEEIKKTEDIVNAKIAESLPVGFEMMNADEAKAAGAIGLFEDKYAKLGNKVKVYTVGSAEKGVFSREICGGPHAENTGQLVHFKITKEEASSAGVRRIKATVG
jgi:alanyl-tRNA synthetase